MTLVSLVSWHWGSYIPGIPGLMRKSWCISEFESCPVSTRSRIARYSSKNHDSKRLNKKENRKDCFQSNPKTEIVKSSSVHTRWKYAVQKMQQCLSVYEARVSEDLGPIPKHPSMDERNVWLYIQGTQGCFQAPFGPAGATLRCLQAKAPYI